MITITLPSSGGLAGAVPPRGSVLRMSKGEFLVAWSSSSKIWILPLTAWNLVLVTCAGVLWEARFLLSGFLTGTLVFLVLRGMGLL